MPRPSRASLERYLTVARIFSALAVGVFCCAAQVAMNALAPRVTTPSAQVSAVFLNFPPRRLFFDAIFQKIFQLAHEFLHIFEIHVDGGEAHVGNLVQFLQAAHDHFSDFCGGKFALRGFVDHAFDFVDDGFELGRGDRALFAGLEQALQDFLAFEAFAAAIFFDDHVGNFVDALVGGKAAGALEALAAAANGIPGAAFAGINHLVINVGAERALHSRLSPRCRLPGTVAGNSCGNSFSSSSSVACVEPGGKMPAASCVSSLPISRSWPSEKPSCNSSGTPTSEHPANVIIQMTSAATVADSPSTLKMVVSTSMEASCAPPPTAGNCTAEPTKEKAKTSMASPKFS